MTNQKNQNLLKNFIDQTWNQQKVDNLNEFIADDYVEHTPFGEFTGLDEFRGFVTMNLRGFPDFEVELQNIVADEKFVACNYVTSGTHDEEYLGIDATGNKTTIHGCYVARIKDGKIVEAWNQFDALNLLTTLEVISPDMLGDIKEGTSRYTQSGTRQ